MGDPVTQAIIGDQVLSALVPEAPIPEKPKVAPVAGSLMARRNKERASQRKYGEAGRAGTMLTGNESTLG